MSWVVFFDIGDTLVTDTGTRASALGCVETLVSAGFRVGIISNTGDLTRTQLIGVLPTDFSFSPFDDELILLSSEHPFEKPSLRIFFEAMQTANTSPDRCVFVGESLEETVAAQSAGMHAVRICNDSADHDFDRIPAHIEKLRSNGFE